MERIYIWKGKGDGGGMGKRGGKEEARRVRNDQVEARERREGKNQTDH